MTEQVDICIVGGGIVGLYCAAELVNAGFLVRLIDKHYIGSSRDNIGDITQHGHAPLLDEFLGFCNQCWQESGVFLAHDLGLMPTGSVQLAFDEQQYAILEADYAKEKLAGMKSYLEQDREVLSDVLGGVELPETCVGGKLISRDMVIDTHTALNNLRQHLVQQGVRIWGSDRVKEFLVSETGAIRGVKTDSGDTCMAQTSIICTGIHTRNLLEPLGIHIPIRPVRGHVLEVTPNGPVPVQMLVHPCEKGYLRMRRSGPGKVLLAYDGLLDPAQSTYTPEIDQPTVDWLREKAGEILPALQNAVVNETKVVTLSTTPDLAPCIGTYGDREGLLVAVGMNGRSYAYAAGAARIIRSILVDEPYPTNLTPMQADRFATNNWTPVDVTKILPTYHKEEGAKAVAESETAEEGSVSEENGTPEESSAEVSIPVEEDKAETGPEAAATDAPAVAEETTLEEGSKDAAPSTAESSGEKPEDTAGNGVPENENWRTEVERAGETQLTGDKEVTRMEVQDREAKEVVRAGEVHQHEKEIQTGNKETQLERTEKVGPTTTPVLTGGAPKEERMQQVEMVEHKAQQAQHVNMVEKKIQRMAVEVSDNNAAAKTAVVQSGQESKSSDSQPMMVSKGDQKVEIAFGAASLVKSK